MLKQYVGEDEDDEAMYSAVGRGAYLSNMKLLHGERPKDLEGDVA